ncbi:unnamed protein product [Cunninghamella echinulata]
MFYQVDYSSLYSETPDNELKWTRVFEEYKINRQENNSPPSSQTFYRTYTLQNISSFQMIGENVIIIHLGNIYAGKLGQIPTLVSSRFILPQKSKFVTPNIFPITSSNHTPVNENAKKITNAIGSSFRNGNYRYDPKLGGMNNDLIAFIRYRDIWITTMEGDEVQLTFCSDHDSLSCGVSEYVMQEEFHRYTGYYWFPSNIPSDMNRILYLETNDEDVELVYFSGNTKYQNKNDIKSSAIKSESAKYPRAGYPNVKSQLFIVEFSNLTNTKSTPNIIHKKLWGNDTIEKNYPWAEYYVRFGWLPDGKSVWVQLLSRDQKKTAVIRIPYTLFKCKEKFKMFSLKYQSKYSQNKIEELWSETSSAWINISDVYYFLNANESDNNNNNNNNNIKDELAGINFIWSSERTGYRHLYYISTSNDQLQHNNTDHYNVSINTNNNNNNNKSNNSKSTIIQLTFGDWCVVDKPIYIDQARKLVYFIAKKDTPLETHLYVTSYAHQKYPTQPIRRLTPLGYSHNITMDIRTGVIVDSMSSLQQPNSLVLRKLIFNDNDDTLPTVNDMDDNNNNNNNHKNDTYPFKKQIATLMPSTTTLDNINDSEIQELFEELIIASPTPPPLELNTQHTENNIVDVQVNQLHNEEKEEEEKEKKYSLLDHQSNDKSMLNGADLFNTQLINSPESSLKTTPQGQIFDFLTSDGVRLYGCLYKPWLYQPGKSYPTLLHIYGGPKTQMITNEFKFPRMLRYLMAVYFGFAVVIIDGRGSSDRGLEFESHLQNRLGQVELQDQIEGLKYLSESCFGALPAKDEYCNNNNSNEENDNTEKLKSVIDLNRVAVTGWSYGGYLSLLALSRFSHFFRIAIAGAPVVDWHLYDTAYTERYMGLPNEYEKEYDQSGILHWVDGFPEEDNRLIIVHGLIDENVHIRNTECLVEKLIEKGKPHKYQVYPTEKHGLRHATVNEHFEVLMFHCLLNYL